MARNTKTSLNPPYCSFSTLKTFVESLSETAVPQQIDRSVMGKMSGITQGQLMSALRFLRLIDASGTATQQLSDLVSSYNTEGWKEAVGDLVSDSYLGIIGDIDIDSATGKALRDRFKSSASVDGQILAKALRFYMKALEEAGLSYSPHFKDATKGLTSGGAKKKTNGNKKPKSAARRRAEKRLGKKPEANDPPDTRRYPLYFKDKPEGALIVPEDLTAADCNLIEKQLEVLKAYAGEE